MKAAQITNDITQWSFLFKDMCHGSEPDHKGHWDLKTALDLFAQHIEGFNFDEKIQADKLTEKFEGFVRTKRYDKALEMENEIFHFIMKVVDK